MLHRQQLNVFRLRLLPLFFIVVCILSVIILPQQVHAVNPFVNETHITACAGPTCTTSALAVTSGNLLVADCYIVQTNVCTVSDTQSNVYTLRVDANSNGVNRHIIYTTTISATGSDTISTSSASVIQFEVVQYTGIIGIGVNSFDNAQTASATFSSTVTLTTSSSAVVYESWAVRTGNSQGGACASLTPNTGTTIFNMPCFDCIVTCGSDQGVNAISAQTILAGGPGTFPFKMSWTSGATQNNQIHIALELDIAQSAGAISATQCYGNCGTPPITVVNTNSTKSINFNLSITLFYEFQSNLNGLINNVTLNYANVCGLGSRCSSNTLSVAAYSAGNCGQTTQPFTASCPGSRLSQATFSPPTKGRLSMICQSCVISNGWWIAVAVSATFSGAEINDTNTNVPLFQSNGIIPNTISQSASASSLCGGCKMGLWAWITGVIITGPGGSIPLPANCGNGIGDYLVCLTLTFCTGTPNAGCQLAGGLFWSMIYSVIGLTGLMWIAHKFLGSDSAVQIPTAAFAFVPLGIQFMFVSLGILPLWWGVLMIMVFTVLFTWILLGFARGSGGRPA